MIKVNLVGAENIQVQIEEGQKIKDIKNKLIELGYEIKGINFIFKGNTLNDNDDLSLKGIHSNATIVYYFLDGRKIKKNPDFKKNEIAIPKIHYNKTNKSVPTENKEEDEGNIKYQNNQNEEKENKEKEKEDEEIALLTKYSSIIKILTYKKNEEDTEKILKNLKRLKNDIFEKICIDKNKKYFLELLKKPINQDDLNTVKDNYKDFIELIEDKDKVNINLTAEESEFIKSQMNKYKMDEAEIILSYINNKFDKEKTKNVLDSLQINKK